MIDSSRGLVLCSLTVPNSSLFIKNHLMTYVRHDYNYEIITGLNNMNKDEYLRFIKLFDLTVLKNIPKEIIIVNFKFITKINFQTWLILFLFIGFLILLMKLISCGRFKIIELLTRSLTNQSCDEITLCKLNFKFKNSLNKFSFVLLIVIWSQSASILTKAFTGLLLNTYFNQKLIPIVETLEDIYLNKEISIASNSSEFEEFSQRIDESNELKSDILARMIEFEKKFNYSELNADKLKEKFLRKLINGEIVIMTGSKIVQEFEAGWEQEKSYFQISSHKYSPNYSYYLVSKLNPMAPSLKIL